MVDLIDDVETIEKSKRVQWDQQAEYRQLFRLGHVLSLRSRSGRFRTWCFTSGCQSIHLQHPDFPRHPTVFDALPARRVCRLKKIESAVATCRRLIVEPWQLRA
jgi:hypothetical protein